MDLPEPFTAQEWYHLSLCAGWTFALANENPGSDGVKQRMEAATGAIAAMRRVLGENFHSRIAACFPSVQPN